LIGWGKIDALHLTMFFLGHLSRVARYSFSFNGGLECCSSLRSFFLLFSLSVVVFLLFVAVVVFPSFVRMPGVVNVQLFMSCVCIYL